MIATRGLVEVQNPKDPNAAPKTFTFDGVYGPEYVQFITMYLA